jgi:hypothetical protein
MKLCFEDVFGENHFIISIPVLKCKPWLLFSIVLKLFNYIFIFCIFHSGPSMLIDGLFLYFVCILCKYYNIAIFELSVSVLFVASCQTFRRFCKDAQHSFQTIWLAEIYLVYVRIICVFHICIKFANSSLNTSFIL